MKKCFGTVIFIFILVYGIVGCGDRGEQNQKEVEQIQKDDNINSDDDFYYLEAVIMETGESAYLVYAENDSTLIYGMEAYVSSEHFDGNMQVGDKIIIKYNGDISESSPAQIDTVYSIEKAAEK